MRLIVLAACALVALAEQPRRIVSTSPSITETLFSIGAGDRVVGVSHYCHYPPEVASRQKVGTWLKPNAEIIARLKPDLVIVQRLPNNLPDRMRSLGVPVLEVDNGDLARNFHSIRAIGRAVGSADRAEALIQRMLADFEDIRRAAAGRPRRTVLFVVGRTPGRLEGIVAVGSASYLNELLAIAGGRNVLADSGTAYPRVALETVVRLNPDVIIDMGEMADTTEVTDERKRAVVRLWESRSELAAARNRRVFAVASDLFVVPGPRMVDAARAITAMLHQKALP